MNRSLLTCLEQCCVSVCVPASALITASTQSTYHHAIHSHGVHVHAHGCAQLATATHDVWSLHQCSRRHTIQTVLLHEWQFDFWLQFWQQPNEWKPAHSMAVYLFKGWRAKLRTTGSTHADTTNSECQAWMLTQENYPGNRARASRGGWQICGERGAGRSHSHAQQAAVIPSRSSSSPCHLRDDSRDDPLRA